MYLTLTTTQHRSFRLLDSEERREELDPIVKALKKNKNQTIKKVIQRQYTKDSKTSKTQREKRPTGILLYSQKNNRYNWEDSSQAKHHTSITKLLKTIGTLPKDTVKLANHGV